jgi:hypothetical protein
MNTKTTKPAADGAGETQQSTAPTAPAAPAPMPVPAGGWPRDKYSDLYGEYVRDPLTGVRSPTEATLTAWAAKGITAP